MENLIKEVTALKNGIEIQNALMSEYRSQIEILSIKLEEIQTTVQPEYNIETISQIIRKWFDNHLPSSVNMSWSDGAFTADFELETMDFLDSELPYNWEQDLSEVIVEFINDSTK
jgi:hypothetical protein